MRHKGKHVEIRAKAVVLACGGFEANAEMRTRYLGPGWDLAKVRGTRFNTGAGIRMALDIGALPYGHWSGCHAVGWDLNAPEFGDLAVGDSFQKHSYPFGIMVNANGERFVDEGADFRNYTYAKYGRGDPEPAGPVRLADLRREGRSTLLRDEYRIKQVTKVRADTLEELVAEARRRRCRGAACGDSRDYNAAVAHRRAVQPDDQGRPRHRGPRGADKSNWANTLDKPPFEAYAVTCGVTFTFGGLQDHQRGRGRGHRRRERDAAVKAWAHLDPDQAIAQAKAADATNGGLLRGIPVGVKDIIDTYDMPTGHNSPIFEGKVPFGDAACVALCRTANAVIMGKTVTTEFANRHPGATTNPHNVRPIRRAARRPAPPRRWPTARCRWPSARRPAAR